MQHRCVSWPHVPASCPNTMLCRRMVRSVHVNTYNVHTSKVHRLYYMPIFRKACTHGQFTHERENHVVTPREKCPAGRVPVLGTRHAQKENIQKNQLGKTEMEEIKGEKRERMGWVGRACMVVGEGGEMSFHPTFSAFYYVKTTNQGEEGK